MCLIAHVPPGQALSREDFDSAHHSNSDGIGVMSADGVQKFLGRKMLKRARKYVAKLAAANIEHAVHWRFATHGAVSLKLAHPFELPDGAGYLMHNGVLSQTAARANAMESDTLLFTRELTKVPRTAAARALYWDAVGRAIGHSNKFAIMHADGSFAIVNEESGTREANGIWYSNQYSLARHDRWVGSEGYEMGTGWRKYIAQYLARYDRLNDYGPKGASPSGPTLEAGEDFEAVSDELWACQHGTPWSDFCEVCDGDKLPGWGAVGNVNV